ncbi:N-acetylmuramoyl-L-alanine amidase [Isoalcanivorax beigongshangi]|uniref:N-acetylmuramoyl-L-alanine amidase n=1 Tax=Isoalcanivorax beigongshangi TaxID=3238810 RepID=A0ABV4AJK1_9GAMM
MRRAAVVLLLLILSVGCQSPPLEQRDGYRVDHRHAATGFDRRVRFIILHYTRSDTERALRTLTGPQVSAHYVVPRQADDGAPRVYQLLPESERAWHAGSSGWAGREHLNDTSIGIEIVNIGPLDTPQGRVWEAYGAGQMAAVAALVRDLMARYEIPPEQVLAHADVAPSRKLDPGPAFPWQWLGEQGLAAWPDDEHLAHYRERFEQRWPSVTALQQALRDYGYPLPVSGVADRATCDTLRAFQMHFHPEHISGQPDTETLARLWALLAEYRPALLAARNGQWDIGQALTVLPACPVVVTPPSG